MFRHHRLNRACPHRAGADMALAATISLFGVLPLILGGGLVVVQIVSYLAH